MILISMGYCIWGHGNTDTGGNPINMPDPIHVQSRSAQKHWLEAGSVILAHWLASGPDLFDLNLSMSLSARTKLDPGRFCAV